MHPFTVRTDPGGAVTDPPFVFLKTFRTDFKAADAAPAKGLFSLAAMAGIAVSAPSAAFSRGCHFFICNSLSSHAR